MGFEGGERGGRWRMRGCRLGGLSAIRMGVGVRVGVIEMLRVGLGVAVETFRVT